MESTPPPADTVFEIAYQEFAGTRYNRELRGKGTLTLRDGGTTLAFAGRKRGLFAGSARVEKVFAAAEIANVVIAGAAVQFTPRADAKGRPGTPFVFFARDAAEAQAIAARLPAVVEEDFAAGIEFHARLREWHGGGGVWSSPTNLIIGANVLVFVFMGLHGAGWFETASMEPFVRFGANSGDLTTDGEWWRLVACMFLHYGLIHLLLNMWALLQVGQLVEKLFGRTLYTLAYLGSGLCGSLGTLLWHRDKTVLSAGASGAVFGIYGALLGYMLHEKHALPKSVYQPVLKSTLVFAGYNLFFGAVHPGIDNAAHVGGLVGGVLLGWLLAVPLDPTRRAALVPRKFAAGVAVVAAIVAGGVTAAPRFDYRLDDEFAWGRVNKEPGEKERALVKQENVAFKAFETSGDREALARWIERETLPFYRHWRDEVAALSLAPGRLTAKRREVFVRVLTMKAESLEKLVARLRSGEAEPLAKFEADEAQTMAELKTMSKDE